MLRRRNRGPPPVDLLARAFAAAAFTGLVSHTLLYAAFLEDPIAWTLLGMAIALSSSSSGLALLLPSLALLLGLPLLLSARRFFFGGTNAYWVE